MKKNRFTFMLIILSIISCKNVYSQGIRFTKDDTIKYIVKNEIIRFFGGTFWSGIEIPIENKKSIYLASIGTYGSPTYKDKEFIGFGAEFQYRSYLGKGKFVTKYPIYLATQLIVRRIWEYNRVNNPKYEIVNGYRQYVGETYDETKRGYTIYYGGMLLGCQLVVNQIFTLDAFFGGGIRLSQIDGEESFSRYKNLTSLDYSGVVPRVGFVLGIIQH